MSPDTFSRQHGGGPDEAASVFGFGLNAARGALEFVGFWIAVALPFVYLPMIALGLATSYPLAFLGMLGANALALAVGHGHDHPSS